MKIYISADIEGIAGIAHWDEACTRTSSAMRSAPAWSRPYAAI